VGHSWSRSLPPHPLLLRARAAQLQAPACCCLPACTANHAFKPFKHSHTQSSHCEV
jgi:hypothetical protein